MAVRHLATEDGRVLEIADTGPEGAPVVLAHHGTPGSAFQPGFLSRAVNARGWRLVTFSRAGCAGSTRSPGRSVSDVASDTRAVLDGIGVERVLVAGVSGGGPHALACAALLPERVAAALIVSGVAPCDADGLDFYEGMGQENLTEFGAASKGEAELRAYLETQAPLLRTASAEMIVLALGSILPDVDRACLTGEVGEDLAASMHDALSGSLDGWIDDDLAFLAPWGFAPGDIAIPVSIWQGDADLMVPFAHGRWLASHVPGARVHLEPAEGHLSIAIGSIEQMLTELAELGGLSGSS